MRYLKTYNESFFQPPKYRELANLIQSEVLDDYEIHEGPVSFQRVDDGNGFKFINEPCWELIDKFKFLGLRKRINGDSDIVYMQISPRNKESVDGKEMGNKIVKDIDSIKERIENTLDISIVAYISYNSIFVKIINVY